MKLLLFLFLLVAGGVHANDDDSFYLKVGAGWKFEETEIQWGDGSKTNPISARIELGKRVGNWSYGVSHHSQWFTGWPINDHYEYHKTEVFVDYEWRF